MKKSDAIAAAVAKGATLAEIEAEAKIQDRQVGTVPFKNMIRALQMHSWNNTKAEWTRLAAALVAKGRKGKS